MEALTIGQEACTPCQKGYYKPSKTAEICQQCEKGYFTLVTGSKACLLCPVGFYCACSDCPPQACPKNSVCPAGSNTFTYCSGLFQYAKNFTTCIKSVQFYVLVIGTTMLIIILLSIGLIVYIKMKKNSKKSSESQKLIYRNKDIVYCGY